MKKLTREIFIERSKLKHGYKYSYDKVIYINGQTKVTLTCEKNHEFQVRPDMHLNRGDGCRICKYDNMMKSNEDFIADLFSIFGELYDYSLVDYKGSYQNVELICKNHGIFSRSSNYLLRGHGCSKCYRNGKLDTERFIKLANRIHSSRYDYTHSEYVNSRSKIKINCPIHGMFGQLANNHLRGHGCKVCDRSKGEIFIENYLKNLNMDFKTEFKFTDLKFKYPLRFDIAVFKQNELSYLIEFNGKQHYQYYPNFHKSETDFQNQVLRDNMKIKYCEDNGIKLYIISYKDNLETELEKIIKENEEEDRIQVR